MLMTAGPAQQGEVCRLLDSLTNENAAFTMKCECRAHSDGALPTLVDHVRLFRNDPGIAGPSVSGML
jgi:hypothetical protein